MSTPTGRPWGKKTRAEAAVRQVPCHRKRLVPDDKGTAAEVDRKLFQIAVGHEQRHIDGRLCHCQPSSQQRSQAAAEKEKGDSRITMTPTRRRRDAQDGASRCRQQ